MNFILKWGDRGLSSHTETHLRVALTFRECSSTPYVGLTGIVWNTKGYGDGHTPFSERIVLIGVM